MHIKIRLSHGRVNKKQDIVPLKTTKNDKKIARDPQVAIEHLNHLQVGLILSPELSVLLGLDHQEPH